MSSINETHSKMTDSDPQAEIQRLRQQLIASHTENKRLRTELERNYASPTQTEINRHGTEFWNEIEVKCLKDSDAVKVLVKTKQIRVNDTNINKQTLLLLAADVGSYNIVQFCINSGFDINHKNAWNETALDIAKYRGYYHIEQLLLFNAMNLSVGNEVKRFAETIHQQNGINQNISNELQLIGDQSKDLFEKTLIEMMITIITKKLSFSDQLLSYCWGIACRDGRDPLCSDLWNVISSTCSDIIKNGDKRDWFWLKRCILPRVSHNLN